MQFEPDARKSQDPGSGIPFICWQFLYFRAEAFISL